MENVLSQFSVDGLDIKLTSEKLFIKTSASSEAIALRSINGIGVVDLIDEYNSALSNWKSKKGAPPAMLFLSSAGFCLMGVFALTVNVGFGLFILVISSLFLIAGFKKIELDKTNVEPKLMSAVRIMLSSGNRDFKFDKTDAGSRHVAEFVASVETTLTAHHKSVL